MTSARLRRIVFASFVLGAPLAAPSTTSAHADEGAGPIDGVDGPLPPKPCFVPPPYNASANIVGKYDVEGTEPDGKIAPTGTATIKRIVGDLYSMTEVIAGATYVAACIRQNDLFACGWGAANKDLSVAVYRAEGSVLDGVFYEDRIAALGRERWTGAAADLTGALTIAQGERPEGGSYSGFVQSDFVSADVYRLTWKIGSTYRVGYGLRDGERLAVGFNAAGSCGLVAYRIQQGGARLRGRWVDAGRPTAGVGVETLTRS